MSARFINPLQVLNVKGVVSPVRPDEVAPLRLTAVNGAATVGFTPSDVIELQTRLNDGEWQPWDYSDITLQDGEYIDVRGDNTAVTGASGLGHFDIWAGQISASGSVMSLIYGADLNEDNNLVILMDYIFFGLFANNTGLVSAPDFPATTLRNYCYMGAFAGCTGLTAAPELPATTLADFCYYEMFRNAGLTAAPDLPATVLSNYCYMSMFADSANMAYISVGFSSWNGDATNGWLNNVAPTGTFHCPAALDQSQRDDSHIPAGWTIETF